MRYAIILCLSASIAIPLSFLSVALPTLLRNAGAPLSVVGLAALAYAPLAFSFLWAPLVDRKPLGNLGLRRSWSLAAGCATAALLALMAIVDPRQAWLTLALACLVATTAATARTASLGYAASWLSSAQRPWGGAAILGGGAVGALVGSGALLAAVEIIGWPATVIICAALTLALASSVLLAPEPEGRGATQTPSLRRFFSNRRNLSVLAYLLPASFALGCGFGMMPPRLVDLGFGLGEIGLINSVFTCLALAAGGPLAAALIGRLDLRSALSLGLVGLTATLVYSAAASLGDWSRLHAAAGLILFYLGYSVLSVAHNTLFMEAASAGQEGTDFAVYVCVVWLLAMIGMIASGWIAQHGGYHASFLTAAALMIAALPLLRAFDVARPAVGAATAR